MPTPASSSSDISCWAPVPEAATMPTGPRLTALANPSPTPPTTAVPQSGPMTSRPSSVGPPLERHLVLTGTLSLKIITSAPASSASIASANAYRPGTEISARLPPIANAEPVVRGRASTPAAAGRAGPARPGLKRRVGRFDRRGQRPARPRPGSR